MVRKLSTWLVLAAIALAVPATGCIGRMGLSGKVMKFNLSVTEDRFGREIVFLILYIIPVYPIAGFCDLIIFNSIEFWSGTNPISGQDRLAKAGDQKHVVGPNGEVAVSTLREDGTIDVQITKTDGSVDFFNLAREDGRVVARDDEGQVLAKADSNGLILD